MGGQGAFLWLPTAELMWQSTRKTVVAHVLQKRILTNDVKGSFSARKRVIVMRIIPFCFNQFNQKKVIALALLFVALAIIFVTAKNVKPRHHSVQETPIAYWAWRTDTPSEKDIQQANVETHARIIFLRAGQFDLEKGELQRIRTVAGKLPASVELHLVYNATRRLLIALEQLAPDKFASLVAQEFGQDLGRAKRDDAVVTGLQLDFDFPTRLLPRYAELLNQLRRNLPTNIKLSITGLPTWANSPDLRLVLAPLDFWIPQCYGTAIPTRVEQQIAISSSTDVERFLAKIRQLNKPFYAGLSAYSYAILYDTNGKLIELRGDLDSDLIAQDRSLALISQQAFKQSGASEIRYVYRAQQETVLDGLVIHEGESLMIDLPTAASLRASARAVRENAGDFLLGICVFRLPTANDVTVLTLAEISAALIDKDVVAKTKVSLSNIGDELQVSAENQGTASAIPGADSFTIDLFVPAGTFNSVTRAIGLSDFETRCGNIESNSEPCSALRANIIRLKSTLWKPGKQIRVGLKMKTTLPTSIPVIVSTSSDENQLFNEKFEARIQNGMK